MDVDGNCPAAPAFEFYGRHLLASYVDCDSAALADVPRLIAVMQTAVRASGATLLDTVHHDFTPAGMTALLLLSESHASVHTYPEHRSCFVDLFTCGRECRWEQFDELLRGYLRPRGVERLIVVRHAHDLDEQRPHAAGEAVV